MLDALELEMRNRFGPSASRFLEKGIGSQGEEDIMMNLFEQAKQRRIARLSISQNRASFEMVQNQLRAFTGADDATLGEVTPDWAKKYLEGLQKSRASLPPDFDEQFGQLNEYMNRIMGQSELGSQAQRVAAATYSTSDAARAASYQRGLDTLSSIEAKAATIAAGNATDTGAVTRNQNLVKKIGQIMEDDILDDYGNMRAAKSNYKRFKFGEFFANKNIRNTAIGAGLLIAGSFMYQSRKDRTESDVTGPPLLPGGNPYESSYPTRESIINEINQPGSYPSSYDYRINTSGSMDDLRKLNSLVGGVVDGPTNTTMYNGLPRMGRDPYSDVASRF